MNIFSKKKKAKHILAMPMFKGENTYSLNNVIQDLREYWSLEINDIAGDDTAAAFNANGEQVMIGYISCPIPDSEFEDLYDFASLWKEAKNDIAQHNQHALVIISPSSTSTVERFKLLTKVIASILRTSETAIGFYYGEVELLVPKEVYLELADFLLEEDLAVPLWVSVNTFSDQGKRSAYTYGLKEFGKPEIEVVCSEEEDELYFLLLDVADYVIRQNVTLKNGETLGFTENQRIKITESKAVYLDGKTLKLEI